MTGHILYKESHFDKFKKRFSRIGSRIENLLLSAALWLTDVFHSDSLNRWIESYTEKRMQRLQHEIIRQQWNKAELEKSLDCIQRKQNQVTDVTD